MEFQNKVVVILITGTSVHSRSVDIYNSHLSLIFISKLYMCGTN